MLNLEGEGRGAPRGVVVMGVSGSGKSTLGQHLATCLRVPFLDGDEFHSAESVARMSANIPLTDDERWPWLTRVGFALGSAARDNGLAIAACSSLALRYRQTLARAAAVPIYWVYLAASPDLLRDRLVARKRHFMPVALLRSQLETLEPPTRDECALTLDAAAPVDALAARVADWLVRERRPHGAS